MPKFTTKVIATNKGDASVSVHVGASLVGASNQVEHFNTSDDVKDTFPIGKITITRYLNTNLGAYQKDYLYAIL